MKDQIVEFLSKGFSKTQVSQICACTISYVAEVEAEYQDVIAANKAVTYLQRQEIDTSLNNLEQSVVARLQAVLPFETSVPVLLRALQILNGAKRKSEPDATTLIQNNTTINSTTLVMPARFVQEKEVAADIVVNGRGEIVEVEGRALINASSGAINQMLNQQVLEARQQQRKAELAVFAAGPQPGDF